VFISSEEEKIFFFLNDGKTSDVIHFVNFLAFLFFEEINKEYNPCFAG
jgi:hypothetical protein